MPKPSLLGPFVISSIISSTLMLLSACQSDGPALNPVRLDGTGGTNQSTGATSLGGTSTTGGVTQTATGTVGGNSSPGSTTSINGGAPAAGTGGSRATGGIAATGGAATNGNATGGVATGGTNQAAGGSPATGGVATGGTNQAAGGSPATGGAPTSGGSNQTAGGTAATGGARAAGGANQAVGGTSATGGAKQATGGAATGGSSVTGGTSAGGSTACSNGTVGNKVGNLAEDFALSDQNGKIVHLSDYCGKLVLLEMGAIWCPVCKEFAAEIPKTMATYGSRGLIVLNLLVENDQAKPPTQSDLAAWASAYGITTPVLADPNWGVWKRYFTGTATPEDVLVGRDGKLLVVGQEARYSFTEYL